MPLDTSATDLLSAPDSHNDPSLSAEDKAAPLLDAAEVVNKPPEPKIKSREDLRRLNRRATQEGMYGGMLGGGAISFFAYRMGMPKNGAVLTFLLTSTGISFLTTRHMIRSALGEHYDFVHARQEAVGGMADRAEGDAAPPPVSPLAPTNPEDESRRRVAEELSQLGKPRPRTMWTKGRGLEGEVEEAQEMVDPYMRSGVPRRDI